MLGNSDGIDDTDGLPLGSSDGILLNVGIKLGSLDGINDADGPLLGP